MVFIPGGYRHNEVATSERVDLIEIFMPPYPDTVRKYGGSWVLSDGVGF